MPPYHPRLPILASKRRMTSGLCWPKIVLRAKGAGGAGRHKSVGAAERAECRYGRVRRERRAAEGAEGQSRRVRLLRRSRLLRISWRYSRIACPCPVAFRMGMALGDDVNHRTINAGPPAP